MFKYEKDQTVPADSFMASAAFAYLTNLIADGNLGQDAGSTIHQTFVTMNSMGLCLDSQMPYEFTDAADYTTPPTPEQYAAALVYKPGSYHSLSTLLDVKYSIASGYPVGIGINVYDSFEGDQLANTGFMPMPAATENLLGGHAQLILDFDDTIVFPDTSIGGVLVQNSWGADWGLSIQGRIDRGFYWMPYAFFNYSDPNGNGLGVSDMWMLHLGKPW
jgi:C1A family cysteine protease